MRPCIEFRYPEFSGCYALLLNERVVYVGKSISVLQRLSNHRNRLRRRLAGKDDYTGFGKKVVYGFDSVRLYPCPMRELDILEKELILLYKPEGNVQIPKALKTINVIALAKRANVDLDKWREITTGSYSLKQSRGYRRVA